ncbi:MULTISPECIES: cyclophilin-like fold protein [unclassified Sphingobacterium]|uniref:cyclophilin-like fold protein n=1 Tax=unclassified Sphingobacterium TaxID=2609468 RepID=UPI0020C25F05|nr:MULTISPECIES: cyclophilin-like fold protein [unclassified Sphingobacterium]
MKHSLILILAFMSIFISNASSCGKEDENNTNTENTTSMVNGKIKITVNSLIFTATLLDNNSAKAFKEMLPLTINMVELNNNEKYFDLPNSLPTNSSNPQAINSGDLMLYGSKTLVLFYKTFSTSYSYTRLGKIDDTTGLATALGSGNVTITINKIED